MKESDYEEDIQYVLKGVSKYPFDDTFETFRNRYKSFMDLKKGKNWRSIITSLHICDQNEKDSKYDSDSDKKKYKIIYFPVKSGDLVFAAFHAFREKSKSMSKITLNINCSEEYKTFVKTFCQTIHEINLQPHIAALLYSDERFQYIDTNEVCLKPLIDKIALILSMIILDQSKERNTLISKMLEKLEEVSAQYLFDNKTLQYDAQSLGAACSLDKVIFDLCKVLRRQNNEISMLKDDEVKAKIQTYVSLYNQKLRNSKETISTEEAEARTAYLEYLNSHIVSEEQKRQSEEYKKMIGELGQDTDEAIYRKNLEEFLFRTKYSPKSLQMALQCQNMDPTQFLLCSEMDDYEKQFDLYQKLLEGSDVYFRELIDETKNAYVNEAMRIHENYTKMVSSMQNANQNPAGDNIYQNLLCIGNLLEERKKICAELSIKNFIKIGDMSCNNFKDRFKSIISPKFYFMIQDKDFARTYEGAEKCDSLLTILREVMGSPVDSTMVCPDLYNQDLVNPIFDIMQKLIFIISLDNMVLHKLLANRHVDTFMERRGRVKQEITARIERIKNDGNVYMEISKGIDNAMHEMLFQLYRNRGKL